MKFMYSLEL